MSAKPDNTVVNLFGPVSVGGQKPCKKKTFTDGHRARLRKRFLQGGAGAMPDYELLELVLFRAVSRKDVKPIAHRLLDEFGDFSRVLSADPQHLAQIDGVGQAVATDLKIVEAATHRMARAKVMQRPVISSWDALVDYCHTAMGHAQSEQFRVLFLNAKNVLIADEKMAQRTVNHVPVYPREVIKRALDLNASALILVHNHPSGLPDPSEEDITLTRQIEQAARAVDITLHDHLIIGQSCEISFRSQGLL